MHTLFFICVPLAILFLAWEGYKNGAFFALYSLTRNLLAFIVAMTYCEPMTGLFLKMFPKLNLHPGPLYWKLIFFALLFGVVFGVMRWCKIKFTPPKVEASEWVDRIGGPAVGLLNGYILTGFVLVLWSLMPFARFIPGDRGRVEPEGLIVNSGGGMLRYYAFLTRRMPGRRTFLLENEPVPKEIDTNGDGKPDKLNDRDGDGLWDPGESYVDVNNNGLWDTGWLWRYGHFADITMEDLRRAESVRRTVYE